MMIETVDGSLIHISEIDDLRTKPLTESDELVHTLKYTEKDRERYLWALAHNDWFLIDLNSSFNSDIVSVDRGMSAFIDDRGSNLKQLIVNKWASYKFGS